MNLNTLAGIALEVGLAAQLLMLLSEKFLVKAQFDDITFAPTSDPFGDDFYDDIDDTVALAQGVIIAISVITAVCFCCICICTIACLCAPGAGAAIGIGAVARQRQPPPQQVAIYQQQQPVTGQTQPHAAYGAAAVNPAFDESSLDGSTSDNEDKDASDSVKVEV